MPKTITKTIDAEARTVLVDIGSGSIVLSYDEVIREDGVVIDRKAKQENISDDLNPGQRNSLLVLLRNAIDTFRARKYA